MVPPLESDNAGVFGEKFGGVDALFSALAFAGVLYTIFLQRADLQAQKEALEAAQREQDRRTFETIFFNLLNLHHQSLNALSGSKGRNDGAMLSGRDVFAKFLDDLNRAFKPPVSITTEEQLLQVLNDALSQISLATNPNVWAYTQNLCVLLRFLDVSKCVEKNQYLEIVRAQLSQQELTWIFCYSLSKNGGESKQLIERQQLLTGWKEIGDLKRLKQCFKPPAFGGIDQQIIAPD